MVLEESRYVCGYVLTFFGDWLVHASDVMVAMDENMYDLFMHRVWQARVCMVHLLVKVVPFVYFGSRDLKPK